MACIRCCYCCVTRASSISVQVPALDENKTLSEVLRKGQPCADEAADAEEAEQAVAEVAALPA